MIVRDSQCYYGRIRFFRGHKKGAWISKRLNRWKYPSRVGFPEVVEMVWGYLHGQVVAGLQALNQGYTEVYQKTLVSWNPYEKHTKPGHFENNKSLLVFV